MSDIEITECCAQQIGTVAVAEYWHHSNGAIVLTLEDKAKESVACPLCNEENTRIR